MRTGRVESNVPYGTGRLEGSGRTGQSAAEELLIRRSGTQTERRFMREMEILKGLRAEKNMAVTDHLLALGLRKKASDIHLEPEREQMTVRDAHRRAAEGMCGCGNEAPSYDPYPCEGHGGYGHWWKNGFPGRPQGASIQGKATDLRVSVIPTIHGEKAVLRFLNTDTVIDSPETFASEENYGKVLDILKAAQRDFYITGPTGSGKTTTLYMILERPAELPGEHCGLLRIQWRSTSGHQPDAGLIPRPGLRLKRGSGLPCARSGRDHGRRDQGQPDAEDQCPGCGSQPSGAFHRCCLTRFA